MFALPAASLLPASGLDRGDAPGAEGAVGRGDGGDFEGGEGDARDAHVGTPAGAVDDGGGADDERAGRAQGVARLARRAARRNHVLDDEDALAGPDVEAAAQRHLPLLA